MCVLKSVALALLLVGIQAINAQADEQICSTADVLLQAKTIAFSDTEVSEKEEADFADTILDHSEETDDVDDKDGPPTCVAEEALRQMLKPELQTPNVLRGVFHDAIDQDNLLVKNKKSGEWVPVEGSYGGVDGCLYSPLTEGTKGIPNPSHNRNIMNGFDWAKNLCKTICKNALPQGLAGMTLCANEDDCEVDLTVLGSLVAVENFGGPKIGMTWGRKKGNCAGSNIVSQFTKDKNVLEKYDLHPALREGPSLTGIDDPGQFRTAFQNLGFDATDQVALMGAHSLGQLQVCAGGLNGIERGPFCRDASKVDTKMVDGSDWVAPSGSFGDGGLWDRTPTQFDNDYFKLFATESFDGKDNCCGKIKGGRCHGRKGAMVHSMRNDDGGATETGLIEGQACGVNWCRSDRKGRTHMKSTKVWAKVDGNWPGFSKSKKHGELKRMIRLAGDWALLASKETRSKVQKFAQDESAFHKAFAVAWGKVISKTHVSLGRCSGKAKAADVETAVANLLG